MRRFFSIMVVCLVALTACGQSKKDPLKQKTPNVVQQKTDEKVWTIDGKRCSDALIRDIGEMLMVGFRGTEVNEKSHIYRDIHDYHVGGVILFEYDAPSGKHHRNISSPKQLQDLCMRLQKITEAPLFIAIDQEGGAVSRLKVADGFPAFASAQAMAQGGPDTVVYYAQLTAKTLNEMGINVNFAPCADVNVNPKSPVIGAKGRSFSEEAGKVAEYCRIWVKEQTALGVVSCLKHFPGHGSADGDTHNNLVDVSKTWSERELEPYFQLVNDVDMVMVAHVVNDHYDAEKPASLSKECIRHQLREIMGFKGLVVTDDMAMGAIVKQYGQEEAIRMALQAGADILCLSNNGTKYDPELVPTTVTTILRLIRNGLVSEEQIHQSASRIREVKKKTLPQCKKAPVDNTQSIKKKK